MAKAYPHRISGCASVDGGHSVLGVLYRTEPVARSTRDYSDRSVAAASQRPTHCGHVRHSRRRRVYRPAKSAHNRRTYQRFATGANRDTGRLYCRRWPAASATHDARRVRSDLKRTSRASGCLRSPRQSRLVVRRPARASSAGGERHQGAGRRVVQGGSTRKCFISRRSGGPVDAPATHSDNCRSDSQRRNDHRVDAQSRYFSAPAKPCAVAFGWTYSWGAGPRSDYRVRGRAFADVRRPLCAWTRLRKWSAPLRHYRNRHEHRTGTFRCATGDCLTNCQVAIKFSRS